MTGQNLLSMNNVGIVVESLDDAISFFTGRAMVEEEWAGRVTGLGNQSVEIALMDTVGWRFRDFSTRLQFQITVLPL